LISQHKSIIVRDDIVVGKIPNTNSDSVLVYNKKQTEKRLKEINNADKAEVLEITKAVAQWGYVLGIKVIAEDLVILNNFIRDSFPNLNIFDLKACVRLVSLDSDLLETDAEHYGKLTMIYVSKVLKAYEKYKSTVCSDIRQKIIKLEQENKPPMPKEERLKNFKELLTNAKKTSDNGESFEDLGGVVYDFIRFNKLIVMDKVLIAKAMEFGENSLKKSISDYERGNLMKIINDVGWTANKKEDLIKREARRYVSQYWVKNMNLDSMLKKLNYDMLLY